MRSLTDGCHHACHSSAALKETGWEFPFFSYRPTAVSSSSQSSFVTNRVSLLSHFFRSFPLWISSKNGSSGFLASHAHQAGCCATEVVNRPELHSFELTISDIAQLCQPNSGVMQGALIKSFPRGTSG